MVRTTHDMRRIDAVDYALAQWIVERWGRGEHAMDKPSEKNLNKMRIYAEKFAEKSGTYLHPDHSVTDVVVEGLARHIEEVGKPLCPCNFYPDKAGEAKLRRWICACDEMQIYKYCHCLLFVNPEGLPITEHLPDDHEGRQIYGLVKDPYPEKGRALRHKAGASEEVAKEGADD
jgi:ferredoxin-thioredoxin reductase catalytic chain